MSDRPVVAVTGATGFFGLHIVAALAREGADIRIFARRDPASERWPGVTVTVVPGNLEDVGALHRLAAGADAVVHAAGLIKARNRAAFMRTNRDGTRAIAEAARRRAPAARFIAISSLAAREPQLSDYAASKRAGEEVARAVYHDALDRLVIIRPPMIYGPGDRETLAIFKAASRAIVPVCGAGRLALVHVTDAASAVARLAVGAGDAGCYTLADPNPAGYAMLDLLGEAAQAMACHPRFIRVPDRVILAAGTVSSLWGRLTGHTPIFTAGKAREMLHPDWSVAPSEMLPAGICRPKIGIAEGFRETVAWYKETRWV